MGILNNPKKVEAMVGGRKLTIETGRLAKQAHGSVFIQYGETSALVTAVCEAEAKEGLDFFPLTIEFQEKFYASGKIPGGFFKKEARPTDWATLNARMVDRPIRPLFPDGFKNPTQVVVTLLSYDGENEPETIAGLGASAALLLSDAPFTSGIATVRVGRIGGEFVINPIKSSLEKADINLLVSATSEAVVMVEGGAKNAAEADVLGAVYFGFDEIKKLIALQKELVATNGKAKRTYTPPVRDMALAEAVKAAALPGVQAAYNNRIKHERYGALKKVSDEVTKSLLASKGAGLNDKELEKLKKAIKEEIGEVKRDYARAFTMEKGHRIDGRAYNEVRPIEVEVGILPRVHGSALFTRGETQALVTITLGTSEDEQLIDSVLGKWNRRAMLHYNFPPYSVGETGRFGGNSRREIGHSALAERAVLAVLPEHIKFPYTIRMVSEILESNGSSSMASVCGSSMALMDAGVPITEATAGIAMGMMVENGKTVILSDILGDEDHLGDMDFKICGSANGLTAVQMDIKVEGVSKEIMLQALLQAREGRLHILKEMEKGIKTARTEMSPYAPKITTLQISTERIKDLIGPGGKNIKNIVATTGVKMDIEDSGKVNIASNDPVAVQKAIEMVKALTEETTIGKIYMGTVVRIEDYGAFVNIMPGTDGLCHVSELDHKRVQFVNDVVQLGDQIPVKVLDVDRQGKIRLSRKAAMPIPSQAAQGAAPTGNPPAGNPPPRN